MEVQIKYPDAFYVSSTKEFKNLFPFYNGLLLFGLTRLLHLTLPKLATDSLGLDFTLFSDVT